MMTMAPSPVKQQPNDDTTNSNNNKIMDDDGDTKLPAKPAEAEAAEGLTRMSSITSVGTGGGPSWFKSLDWFRSSDSCTDILRQEVFKSDDNLSFDKTMLAAAASTGSIQFPPPLAGAARSTSTCSQDSWLQKMLSSYDGTKASAAKLAPPPAASAAASIPAAPAPLARNTSTSSQSSIMQKMVQASKGALSKMCTSGDWASDLTLHVPVNVADVFKTSSQDTVPTTATSWDAAALQQQPHEELAAALQMAHAVPGRRPAAKITRPTAAAKKSSTTSCYDDFLKEMQAACAPTTTASSSSNAAAGRLLQNPPPPVVVKTEQERAADSKKQPSRKRKQQQPLDNSDESDGQQGNVAPVAAAAAPVAVQPTDKDVLMGRGGRTNNHPGNKEYLKAKDAMQERYMAATKQGKTPISQELVDKVHGWGGRFLQLVGKNTWHEVDAVTARKKCSQTLREVNTPEVRKAKRTKYCKA